MKERRLGAAPVSESGRVGIAGGKEGSGNDTPLSAHIDGCGRVIDLIGVGAVVFSDFVGGSALSDFVIPVGLWLPFSLCNMRSFSDRAALTGVIEGKNIILSVSLFIFYVS